MKNFLNWARNFAGTRSFHLVLLLLAVILVYHNTLRNDFVLGDDTREILNNASLRNVSSGGVRDILFKPVINGFYTPVKQLSYLLTFAGWGFDPSAFHFGNDILHLLAVLLCYLFLLTLTGRKNFSFLAALFFAVHPVHSHAVNGIAARGHILVAVFSFLTLYLYVLAEKNAPGYRAPAKISLYLLSLLSFVLGAFSQPTILPLPLLLLVYGVWGADNPGGFKERLTKSSVMSAPFFLAAALSWTVIFRFFGSNHPSFPVFDVYGYSALYRSLAVFYQYFINTIIPVDADWGLSVRLPLLSDYGFYITRVLILSAFGYLCAVMIRWHKWMVVAPAVFVIYLLPALTSVNVENPFALRYTYFCSMGVYMLLAGVLDRYLLSSPGFNSWKALKCSAYTVLALIFCVLALNSFQRNKQWRDSYTYWTSFDTAETGARPYALLCVYDIEQKQQKYKEAEETLRRAEQLAGLLPEESYPRYLLKLRSNIYYEILKNAALQRDSGGVKNACYELLKLDPGNASPLYLFAGFLVKEGKPEEARGELKKAGAIYPAGPKSLEELNLTPDNR